jgi:uncharacterized protein YjbI with pentapeptide repeats
MTRSPTARQRLAGSGWYPEVSREDFSGTDLVAVRVSRWFTRCSFAGADLRQATLDGCHFTLCDFRGATLRGASLRGVSWSGSDLRDTDLRDTELTGARFSWVNTGTPPYGRTDVTGARFDGATVRHVHLANVIGWELDQ